MTPTIAISINSSWNILNFRAGLVRAIRAAGYHVVALTPDDAMVPRLAELGIDHVAMPIESAGLSPLADARLLAAYFAALRRLRPVAYLGWTIKPNIYGSLAAHALGIPVINNVAGLGTAFLGRSWLQRLASGLYRAAFSRSAVVFFQNADDRALFSDGGLVDALRTRLLPGSGIALEHFPVAPLPDEPGCVFLLVARVLRDKGVAEYAEAARSIRARHPTARFQLLGPLDALNRTAIPRAVVEGWVADGSIEYLGSADDVRPHIARADCIVLPSYREGLPRTLLEGAAMGRPLVAADVPGCRDVIEDGVSGLLCDARDAGALAAAMAAMLALPSQRRTEMGLAGRHIVETRFAERIVVQHYLQAIREVTRTRRTIRR